jgi:hypothetical protein
MANTEAYLVLKDTALPMPVRTVVTTDGVLRDELSERDRERADNGDLDHLLEAASLDEALAARETVEHGLFVPEHEAERYALLEAGHRVVEKDQLLDMKSAGAEGARAFLEDSRKGPNDANPEITEQASFVEAPNLADVSRGDVEPSEVEHDNEPVVPAEVETAVSSSAAGVEQPPGLPIGPVLAKAEGLDPEKVDKEAQKAPKRAARKRPGSESDSESK